MCILAVYFSFNSASASSSPVWKCLANLVPKCWSTTWYEHLVPIPYRIGQRRQIIEELLVFLIQCCCLLLANVASVISLKAQFFLCCKH